MTIQHDELTVTFKWHAIGSPSRYEIDWTITDIQLYSFLVSKDVDVTNEDSFRSFANRLIDKELQGSGHEYFEKEYVKYE